VRAGSNSSTSVQPRRGGEGEKLVLTKRTMESFRCKEMFRIKKEKEGGEGLTSQVDSARRKGKKKKGDVDRLVIRMPAFVVSRGRGKALPSEEKKEGKGPVTVLRVAAGCAEPRQKRGDVLVQAERGER